MNYKRFSNEELKKYPYPNLIAEWRESGYSMCTLGDYMGLGQYRQEDDPEIWEKLKGVKDISASETLGLARLFNVDLKYLFSSELKLSTGMPVAYWRWYDSNKRKEEELKRDNDIWAIERELRKRPELLEDVKRIVFS